MTKETIMKISEHEDVRAMKPYIRIREKFYADELKPFIEKKYRAYGYNVFFVASNYL